MALVLELPKKFPTEYVPETQDIVLLVKNQDWDTLSKVPVCIDSYGEIVATYGQSIWDCSPYTSIKGGQKNQEAFDFNYLNNNPGLLLQAKLITYGWLYQLGNKSGRRCKLSTIAVRSNGHLKRVLTSLIRQKKDDLCALHDSEVWAQLEIDLEKAELSASSIAQTFVALEAVSLINNWLPFQLKLQSRNFTELARKLAAPSKIEKQQTLAIPQSLADLLYGEALNQVEKFWPHREKLAQLEQDLQANWAAGQAVVDRKITSGRWQFLLNIDGQLKKHMYSQEVIKVLPQKQNTIIINALRDTGLLPEYQVNGRWLVSCRAQLQAACFICCGAFSGMRVSELFELHKDSFYSHEINDQIFHTLRAATHKLAANKKNEEWLCSPVVEKAIDVAVALSASSREQLLLVAKHAHNPAQADQLRTRADCLWLSQRQRSNTPIIIDRSQWNKRLKTYAKTIGALIDNNALVECRMLNPQHNGAIEKNVKIGQPWPFATHQFRRTFACFAVRNNLGHPIAIKQQFKHLYLRMSEWYGNGAVEARLKDIQLDSDLAKILNETSIEYTTATYDRWFNGDEPLSGSHGKAIVAMRNDKPVIYSSWDNLYKLVKEKRLTLHGTLHSYCKNGYDCDMDGVVNPAFCVDCKSGGSVIDSEKARWWQHRHAALTTYLHQQENVSLGEYAHFITQIRAAENVMQDHSLEYQVYKHPVEVIEL